MGNFEFTPKEIHARPGDTVVWTNRDIVPHTATAQDKSWDTELIASGESKVIVVRGDMTSSYFCAYHPSMLGSLKINSD
ncbi:MAG: plastocyanin/azurin family copper-binding protein [Pseudomonadota bacterium]